jgi:hypothetical protein
MCFVNKIIIFVFIIINTILNNKISDIQEIKSTQLYENESNFFTNQTLSLNNILSNEQPIYIKNSLIFYNNLSDRKLYNKTIVIQDSLLIFSEGNFSILTNDPIILVKYYFKTYILPSIENYSIYLINVRIK